MTDRCTNIALANEYWPAASRCERTDGHDGPHLATVSASSRRIWQDVPIKMNFIENDDCREAQDNTRSKEPFTP